MSTSMAHPDPYPHLSNADLTSEDVAGLGVEAVAAMMGTNVHRTQQRVKFAVNGAHQQIETLLATNTVLRQRPEVQEVRKRLARCAGQSQFLYDRIFSLCEKMDVDLSGAILHGTRKSTSVAAMQKLNRQWDPPAPPAVSQSLPLADANGGDDDNGKPKKRKRRKKKAMEALRAQGLEPPLKRQKKKKDRTEKTLVSRLEALPLVTDDVTREADTSEMTNGSVAPVETPSESDTVDEPVEEGADKVGEKVDDVAQGSQETLPSPGAVSKAPSVSGSAPVKPALAQDEMDLEIERPGTASTSSTDSSSDGVEHFARFLEADASMAEQRRTMSSPEVVPVTPFANLTAASQPLQNVDGYLADEEALEPDLQLSNQAHKVDEDLADLRRGNEEVPTASALPDVPPADFIHQSATQDVHGANTDGVVTTGAPQTPADVVPETQQAREMAIEPIHEEAIDLKVEAQDSAASAVADKVPSDGRESKGPVSPILNSKQRRQLKRSQSGENSSTQPPTSPEEVAKQISPIVKDNEDAAVLATLAEDFPATMEVTPSQAAEDELRRHLASPEQSFVLTQLPTSGSQQDARAAARQAKKERKLSARQKILERDDEPPLPPPPHSVTTGTMSERRNKVRQATAEQLERARLRRDSVKKGGGGGGGGRVAVVVGSSKKEKRSEKTSGKQHMDTDGMAASATPTPLASVVGPLVSRPSPNGPLLTQPSPTPMGRRVTRSKSPVKKG